ncbi:hypothetical protein AGIG_G21887 [Arapaima gigas]
MPLQHKHRGEAQHVNQVNKPRPYDREGGAEGPNFDCKLPVDFKNDAGREEGETGNGAILFVLVGSAEEELRAGSRRKYGYKKGGKNKQKAGVKVIWQFTWL